MGWTRTRDEDETRRDRKREKEKKDPEIGDEREPRGWRCIPVDGVRLRFLCLFCIVLQIEIESKNRLTHRIVPHIVISLFPFSFLCK